MSLSSSIPSSILSSPIKLRNNITMASIGVIAALIASVCMTSLLILIPTITIFVVPNAAAFSSSTLSTRSQRRATMTTTSIYPALHPSSFSTTPISSSTCLSAIRRGGGRRPDGGRKTPEFVPTMNNEIKNTDLRVNISTKDGKDESLGIMTKAEALAKAKELGGLDLILINENSDPPVCKIVDYSKYRYSLEKKRKEKAKNSKATEIKEVKMSYIIGDHDYDVRLRAAAKFIRSGNRVKATIQFRGREVQHDNLGVELLGRMASDLEAIANMEGKPRREGRTLGAILSPRAEVVKALNDAKRLKEREKKKAKAESLAKRMEAESSKAGGGSGGTITMVMEGGGGSIGLDDDEDSMIGGLFDGIDLEEDDDDDDDEFDDSDFDDADLDELLGSSKVADDLFT